MMRKRIIFFCISCVVGCSHLREENNEKASLYVEMANTQIENNNLAAALKDLLTAEKLAPENPVVHNNLGLVYFLRERLDLSETHFLKALKIQPEFTDARNNYGRLLIEKSNYASAEKELQRVLNDLTYVPMEKALINMGLLNFNQKKYDKASHFFSKAVQAQMDNCTAHSYLGRSLFELEKYSEASSALDRAIHFCQKQLFDEPHYYSALSYYRLGNKQKSMTRFEELLNYYPQGKYREKSRGMLDLIRKGH